MKRTADASFIAQRAHRDPQSRPIDTLPARTLVAIPGSNKGLCCAGTRNTLWRNGLQYRSLLFSATFRLGHKRFYGPLLTFYSITISRSPMTSVDETIDFFFFSSREISDENTISLISRKSHLTELSDKKNVLERERENSFEKRPMTSMERM